METIWACVWVVATCYSGGGVLAEGACFAWGAGAPLEAGSWWQIWAVADVQWVVGA